LTGDDRLDQLFDRYAVRLRDEVGSDVALVTLVGEDRQRFVGAIGLTGREAETRQTALSHSFCRYVVRDQHPLVVSDARLVPELADNPAIPELDVIAYAGWPITRRVAAAPDDVPGRLVSETLGVVCVIDHEPREWSSRELLALCDMAQECAGDVEDYLRRTG
jgi:GAF domain-containing protein